MTIANSPSDYRELAVDNIDRLFQLFVIDPEVRELANQISCASLVDPDYSHKISRLIAKENADSLFHRYSVLKRGCATILDPEKQNALHLSIKPRLLDSVQEISDIDLSKERLEQLYVCIVNELFDETQKLLLEFKINVKKHYDSFLWPIYSQRNDRSHLIHEDNCWKIGLLFDLLCEHRNNFFVFNGVKNGKLNICYSLLLQIYQKKGSYDLNQEPQFNKYGLIEICNGRILCDNALRIVDEKFGISVGVKYLNTIQYQFIKDVFAKYSMVLSLYPDCNEIKGFIDHKTPLLEAILYGVPQKIEALKRRCKKHYVKFIDYGTQDSFFIKTNSLEITFEEISQDFQIFEDSVVTKVLHVLLEDESNEIFCSHIDFEYVFYSFEEFQARIGNGGNDIKGTAFKRQKVFKIDSAKLRPHEVLYPLAHASFRNKELVDEYFAMIDQIDL